MAKKLPKSKKLLRPVHKKHPKKRDYTVFLVFGIIAVLGVVAFFVRNSLSLASSGGRSLWAIQTKSHKPVCPPGQTKTARCTSEVQTDEAGAPLASSSPSPYSYGPKQFHFAYNLPCVPGGPVTANCPTPGTFGPVIAVVNAYHTPNLETELAVYSSQFGLPPCTQANGCLQIVNQSGGPTLPTGTNQSWALETAMDTQVVHAVCQTCKILLVEANSNSFSDLGAAINTAANFGAVAISNSWGSTEFTGETTLDAGYLNHPGIALVFSSGDSGNIVSFPSASPYVISVGGTTLRLYTDSTYASESVWSGAGSGCSLYELATADQLGIATWNATGCGTKRGTADISAVADPNTGAAVYSTNYGGTTGWWQVGGTSLSAPIVAGAIALANAVPAGTNASSMLYKNYSANNYHDVTTGSNGSCGTIMCTGAPGYDGGSGLGSPNGLGAFGGPVTPLNSPTNTPTVSPNATPTSTPVPLASPTPSGDRTAPTTTITYPTNKTRLTTGQTITFTATASDNVGVKYVKMDVLQKNYITGNKITFTSVRQCIVYAPPYTCTWTVPTKKPVTYDFQAWAEDTSGNQGGGRLVEIKVTN